MKNNKKHPNVTLHRSGCMICNHEKYASSGDDTASDHVIEQTTNQRFMRSVKKQYQGHTGTSRADSMSDSVSASNSETKYNQKSESNNKLSESDNKQSESGNKMSESDNKQSVSDNLDKKFNKEYSTEEEEEAESQDEDDEEAERNDKENSDGAKVDANIGDSEKDASPDIMPYSHHRRKTHHRISYTNVVLPSGRKDTIIAPNISGWKCGMRTRMTTLKPNGRMGRIEYNMVAKEMGAIINNGQNIFCTLLIDSPLCSSLFKIIKIQKLVNGCILRKFKNYQDVVRREAGYLNERLLFHGTPHAGKLLKYGFDERLASTGGLFGAGIYFAEHSVKSNKYAFGLGRGCKLHYDPNCSICVRKMFLCRVTLGKTEELSMPKRFAHAPIGKHSVKAKPGTVFVYPEYVVYRGEQAYPEYLISYRST